VQWRHLGVQAGLPIRPLTLSSAESLTTCGDEPSSNVLVIAGDMICEGVPTTIRDAVRQLATLAETPLLGVRFAGHHPSTEGWQLIDATPFPDLSAAGEPGLTALRTLLLR
jgi:hypothetical protein